VGQHPCPADQILLEMMVASILNFGGRSVEVPDEFSRPSTWFSVTLDGEMDQTTI
jgi:hypothetical protein